MESPRQIDFICAEIGVENSSAKASANMSHFDSCSATRRHSAVASLRSQIQKEAHLVFELTPFLESDPPIVISLKLIVLLYCLIQTVSLFKNILGLQVPNLKKF